MPKHSWTCSDLVWQRVAKLCPIWGMTEKSGIKVDSCDVRKALARACLVMATTGHWRWEHVLWTSGEVENAIRLNPK